MGSAHHGTSKDEQTSHDPPPLPSSKLTAPPGDLEKIPSIKNKNKTDKSERDRARKSVIHVRYCNSAARDQLNFNFRKNTAQEQVTHTIPQARVNTNARAIQAPLAPPAPSLIPRRELATNTPCNCRTHNVNYLQGLTPSLEAVY